MLKKITSKLRYGKTAGPQVITLEIIRVAVDKGATVIRNLALGVFVMERSQLSGSKSSVYVQRQLSMPQCRPKSKVKVGSDKLVVVAYFCYKDDMPFAGRVCELGVTTCVKTDWKKFRELLPVLTSRHLYHNTLDHAYISCILSKKLNASTTWRLA